MKATRLHAPAIPIFPTKIIFGGWHVLHNTRLHVYAPAFYDANVLGINVTM